MVLQAWSGSGHGPAGVRFAAPTALGPVVIAALLLTSCGLVRGTQRMFGGKLPMEVTVAPEANDNSPVAVDLLLVYDKKALEKLQALSADKWFAGREQYRRDLDGDLEVFSWEWVPGQQVARQQAPYRPGVKASLVFADYFSPGDHRVLVDHRRPFRLVLGEKDLSVEPLKE
jgi:type VI secretion system protein